MSTRRTLTALAGLAAAAGLYLAQNPVPDLLPTDDVPAATNTASAAAATPGSAIDQLEDLPIKGRAPKTGYSREQFGPAWSDAGTPKVLDGARNGCDTRNDILRRDLTRVRLAADSRGCVVLAGHLNDPYTATAITFARGPRSAAVQIDHVIALSNAWQSGAQQLSDQQRLDLANDPLNLLAVDGPTNAAKGDGDAATWLPPNKDARCSYIARQISVKARHQLWVTPAEKDAMHRVLSRCPDQPSGQTQSWRTPALEDTP